MFDWRLVTTHQNREYSFTNKKTHIKCVIVTINIQK
jgi:hypothetical protein